MIPASVLGQFNAVDGAVERCLLQAGVQLAEESVVDALEVVLHSNLDAEAGRAILVHEVDSPEGEAAVAVVLLGTVRPMDQPLVLIKPTLGLTKSSTKPITMDVKWALLSQTLVKMLY